MCGVCVKMTEAPYLAGVQSRLDRTVQSCCSRLLDTAVQMLNRCLTLLYPVSICSHLVFVVFSTKNLRAALRTIAATAAAASRRQPLVVFIVWANVANLWLLKIGKGEGKYKQSSDKVARLRRCYSKQVLPFWWWRKSRWYAVFAVRWEGHWRCSMRKTWAPDRVQRRRKSKWCDKATNQCETQPSTKQTHWTWHQLLFASSRKPSF